MFLITFILLQRGNKLATSPTSTFKAPCESEKKIVGSKIGIVLYPFEDTEVGSEVGSEVSEVGSRYHLI